MKGEKGNCTQGEIGSIIRRTKFGTEAQCKAAMHQLQGIGVIPSDYIVYECKCGFWHFGKKEWKELYQK